MDWGYDPDAFCYHLHAVRRYNLIGGAFTRIVTFAELYGTRKDPSEWAVIIRNMESKLPKAVRMRYLDPSAFNKDPKGGSSVAEVFRRSGVPCIKANNDRAMGWQAMRDWQGEAMDGLPMHQITAACPRLIEQIGEAERDPKDSFDIMLNTDHALDSCRYFVISRTPTRYNQPKHEVKVIRQEILTPETFIKELKKGQNIRIGEYLLRK